jgi:hypothetical protein
VLLEELKSKYRRKRVHKVVPPSEDDGDNIQPTDDTYVQLPTEKNQPKQRDKRYPTSTGMLNALINNIWYNQNSDAI